MDTSVNEAEAPQLDPAGSESSSSAAHELAVPTPQTSATPSSQPTPKKKKNKKTRTLLDNAKIDDDVLSYLFVDLGFYRKEDRMCRKMQRDDFQIPKRINWDSLLNLLHKVKAGELHPKECIYQLLKRHPLSAIGEGKIHIHARQHLHSHVDRYMEFWVPNCGFELFKTTRYKTTTKQSRSRTAAKLLPALPASVDNSINGQEGPSSAGMSLLTTASVASPNAYQNTEEIKPPLDLGVRATRDYEVNEFIRLYGSALDLTDEEDEEMRMDQSQLKADFSVIYNVSKSCSQILMGPARFVNHDCNANVELVRSGKHLTFKVKRPIRAGEEILTYYGDTYFGLDNENCRCQTCKINKRGDFEWPKRTAEERQRAREAAERAAAEAAYIATRSGRVHDRSSASPVAVPKPKVVINRGTRQSSRTSTQKASKKSERDLRKNAKASWEAKVKAEQKRRVKRALEEAEESERQERRQKLHRSLGGVDGSDSDLTEVGDGEQEAFSLPNETVTIDSLPLASTPDAKPVFIPSDRITPGPSHDEEYTPVKEEQGEPDIKPAPSYVKRESDNQLGSIAPIQEENVPSPLGSFVGISATPPSFASSLLPASQDYSETALPATPSRAKFFSSATSTLMSTLKEVAYAVSFPTSPQRQHIDHSDVTSTSSTLSHETAKDVMMAAE